MRTRYSLSYYDEHPKSCDRRDFWGQVRRTINDQPVGEEQIDMIVAAVTRGLDLQPDDRLLDLCCGNGALTDRFLAACRDGLGVDASEVLVSVAHEFFQRAPERVYTRGDVLDYVASEPAPESFTKAACYGSFSYLPYDKGEALLVTLARRFTGIERLFLGSLPDRDRLQAFYREREYVPGIEHEPGSAIGIWRSAAELAALAAATGWSVEIRRMPEAYFASHYRFDAVLTPCR